MFWSQSVGIWAAHHNTHCIYLLIYLGLLSLIDMLWEELLQDSDCSVLLGNLQKEG